MFNIPTSNTQNIFITGANRYDIEGKVHCSVHSLAQIVDNGFGFCASSFGITPEALDQLRSIELPTVVECEVRQSVAKNRSGKTIGVSDIIGVKIPDTKIERPAKS